MSQYQLIVCQVNIGGDRGTVIVRDRFRPFTYPEYLLMQVLHGGEEHVHHVMSVGYEERDPVAEFDRLGQLYGEEVVAQAFPGKIMPLGNEAMLTEEEYTAGEAAAAKARSGARAKRGTPAKVELPDSASQVA